MKKEVFMLLALFMMSACAMGNKKSNESAKPVITVTISPQKFFIEQIAGDFFDINVILPPGSSPEDYEPSPKLVEKVVSSQFYFYIGHLGFEKTWMKKLSETIEGVKFVSSSKGIDLLRGDCDHKHDHSHHSHEVGTDPHIWTSPENVKTISRTIFTELSATYPAQQTIFENNLNRFIAQIDTLDNHIRHLFNDSLNNAFMIYHPALGYFARDYHLTQYSIEFEGKSPSTAHMKRMVDTARKENISTIFIQSQFETAKAEAIAKEINAKIVSIDPLAENWLDEMNSLAEKMKQALVVKKPE